MEKSTFLKLDNELYKTVDTAVKSWLKLDN